MGLLALQLNRPEFEFLDLGFAWIAVMGLAGFFVAWLVGAIMELTGLSCRVWHLPLFLGPLWAIAAGTTSWYCLSASALKTSSHNTERSQRTQRQKNSYRN
jgi:hypothetical protein